MTAKKNGRLSNKFGSLCSNVGCAGLPVHNKRCKQLFVCGVASRLSEQSFTPQPAARPGADADATGQKNLNADRLKRD